MTSLKLCPQCYTRWTMSQYDSCIFYDKEYELCTANSPVKECSLKLHGKECKIYKDHLKIDAEVERRKLEPERTRIDLLME